MWKWSLRIKAGSHAMMVGRDKAEVLVAFAIRLAAGSLGSPLHPNGSWNFRASVFPSPSLGTRGKDFVHASQLSIASGANGKGPIVVAAGDRGIQTTRAIDED